MTPLAESLAGLIFAIGGAASPAPAYTVQPYFNPYSGASSQSRIQRMNEETLRQNDERERDRRYESRIEQLEYQNQQQRILNQQRR